MKMVKSAVQLSLLSTCLFFTGLSTCFASVTTVKVGLISASGSETAKLEVQGTIGSIEITEEKGKSKLTFVVTGVQGADPVVDTNGLVGVTVETDGNTKHVTVWRDKHGVVISPPP